MTRTATGLICLRCDEATNGVVLCAKCRRTAELALTNITAYVADLLQLPVRPSGVRRRFEMADPTGGAVSARSGGDPIEEAADEASQVLGRWMRRLIADRPRLHYPELATVEILALRLGQHMKAIVLLDWAADFVRELVRTELRLRRILEAHNGLWFAGRCGQLDGEYNPVDPASCGRMLYADPDEAWVYCASCRTTWPVADRRRYLLDEARNAETNVATIARALMALLDGQPSQARLERRIQNWVDRGRIERRGHVDLDGKVRKVYRLGDVLDLLLEERGDTPQRGAL